MVSPVAERQAQKWVAISFYLLAPYVAAEAVETLIEGAAAETSWTGIGLTAGTLVLCPLLGIAKQRIGAKLGSRATYGEGTQNVLCAILAGAVLVGLAANTLFGMWWLDPTIALAISLICVREGYKAWQGEPCGCATCG
jgi:divalent metal cation (Fe/Co/Zn/Cd) transporter